MRVVNVEREALPGSIRPLFNVVTILTFNLFSNILRRFRRHGFHPHGKERTEQQDRRAPNLRRSGAAGAGQKKKISTAFGFYWLVRLYRAIR